MWGQQFFSKYYKQYRNGNTLNSEIDLQNNTSLDSAWKNNTNHATKGECQIQNLHWNTACLVVVQYCNGGNIVFFPYYFTFFYQQFRNKNGKTYCLIWTIKRENIELGNFSVSCRIDPNIARVDSSTFSRSIQLAPMLIRGFFSKFEL
jgi:hypothetical protein